MKSKTYIVQTDNDRHKSRGEKYQRAHLVVEGIQVKVTDDDDKFPGGIIEGHASVFNNVDRHGEVVKPGAFRKTIRESEKNGVYFMDSHKFFEGTSAVIGRTIELSEDKDGLYFKAYLSDTPRAQEIRQKVKEGILDKLSFGFQVLKEKIDRETGVRELLEIKLHEISVVVFPANPLASITGAKGIGVSICADEDRPFDSIMASRRVDKFIGDGIAKSDWNDTEWSRKAEVHLYVDESAPTEGEAYKGLLVDVIDGELQLVKKAVEQAKEIDSEMAEKILARWESKDVSEEEESEEEPDEANEAKEAESEAETLTLKKDGDYLVDSEGRKYILEQASDDDSEAAVSDDDPESEEKDGDPATEDDFDILREMGLKDTASQSQEDDFDILREMGLKDEESDDEESDDE